MWRQPSTPASSNDQRGFPSGVPRGRLKLDRSNAPELTVSLELGQWAWRRACGRELGEVLVVAGGRLTDSSSLGIGWRRRGGGFDSVARRTRSSPSSRCVRRLLLGPVLRQLRSRRPSTLTDSTIHRLQDTGDNRRVWSANSDVARPRCCAHAYAEPAQRNGHSSSRLSCSRMGQARLTTPERLRAFHQDHAHMGSRGRSNRFDFSRTRASPGTPSRPRCSQIRSRPCAEASSCPR